MTTDAEVEAAVTNAPDGTRAFLRSVAVSRLGEDLVAASWDSLVLNAGAFGVVRLPMHEPLKGTRELLADRVEGIETAEGLLKALGVDRLTVKND